ncbi:MAG: O-phosphoserine--tRNA ligase [Candidatus Hodarchaeaceae archaeon]|nr:O-phosphoserine--tRNA ligase [Candidatus Hodarchaeaceae archaeon]
MVKFDVRKLRARAKRDYERTWLEAGELIEKRGRLFTRQEKREVHPLFELIERTRRALLELGFTEVVVPMLVDKREVQAQYGPESSVILDRIFFLAGLERPDIGIGRKKIQQIKKLAPGFKRIKKLQGIFRRYKRGKIVADDLVEVMVRELGLKEEQATGILSLFPEFKELRPVPMDLTLRSHTTAGWFSVLRELQHRKPLPLQLFSIGPKFRREQRLDESHLYESWTASVVVMAERISTEDGERLSREALSKLGFGDVKLVYKKATSKYYAPRTEFEVFIKHPKTGEFVEVGDAGFYSPVALANYEIPYPVFNLGIGLERLLMVETGETDMRALIFPYLYKPAVFSDAELAQMIKIERGPESEAGREIAAAIARVAEQHADEPSPCEFEAYEGEVFGMRVKVSVVEPESKTKLIGPAGFNEIRVYNGNIVGLPPKGWADDEFLKSAREKGVSAGVRFIDAFAALAASEIEAAARKKERQVKVRVKNVKLPSDINLAIDKVAQRYITANKKRIDIRGPVFTTVVAEFS